MSRTGAVHKVILQRAKGFGQITNDQDYAVQPRVTECPSVQVIDRLVAGLSRVENPRNCYQLAIAGQTNETISGAHTLLQARVAGAFFFYILALKSQKHRVDSSSRMAGDGGKIGSSCAGIFSARGSLDDHWRAPCPNAANLGMVTE
jgi:hypothetical protein